MQVQFQNQINIIHSIIHILNKSNDKFHILNSLVINIFLFKESSDDCINSFNNPAT